MQNDHDEFRMLLDLGEAADISRALFDARIGHEIRFEAASVELVSPFENAGRITAIVVEYRAGNAKLLPAPIDMLLYCPRCGTQHVDAPHQESGWTNPPHRTHLCAHCGALWRPSDSCTNGVAKLKSEPPQNLSAEPPRIEDRVRAAMNAILPERINVALGDTGVNFRKSIGFNECLDILESNLDAYIAGISQPSKRIIDSI